MNKESNESEIKCDGRTDVFMGGLIIITLLFFVLGELHDLGKQIADVKKVQAQCQK